MAAIASSITVKELRQKARDLNIKDWYKLKKEDLLRAVADFKIKVPEVDFSTKLEMEKDAIPGDLDKANEEATNSPKRTVSWIILIAMVIFVPLFAWWISQPDPWYQQVLDLFKF